MLARREARVPALSTRDAPRSKLGLAQGKRGNGSRVFRVGLRFARRGFGESRRPRRKRSGTTRTSRSAHALLVARACSPGSSSPCRSRRWRAPPMSQAPRPLPIPVPPTRSAAPSSTRSPPNDSRRSAGSGLPGIVLALSDPRCGYFTAAVGSAALSPVEPMTAAHGMSIGSITKTFVAVTALKLVAEGKLSLDDPLAKWFPTFEGAGKVLVRHLLSHRSGVNEYLRSTYTCGASNGRPRPRSWSKRSRVCPSSSSLAPPSPIETPTTCCSGASSSSPRERGCTISFGRRCSCPSR